MAKQNLTLGEDGIYHPIRKGDAQTRSDSCCYDSPKNNTQIPATDLSDTPTDARRLHLKTSISSSISGPGIGDNVADKKAALLGGAGIPQVGRREAPDPQDNHSGQKLYVVGLILALVVLAVVFALVMSLGNNMQL